LIKYGVITADRLLDDLRNWSSLYIAGRLHKKVEHGKAITRLNLRCFLPQVMILQDDSSLHDALQSNLRSAFNTACLLLPRKFSNVELFQAIAGLSYHGDVRMRMPVSLCVCVCDIIIPIHNMLFLLLIGFAEHPNKVRNIVLGNLDGFQNLYQPFMQKDLQAVSDNKYEVT
jgi:mitochondrial translocator assembly and maintenance protein 41